tara:strand:+ start:3686 stop:4093 length:408 start_codon:yes stop_codon:yes gene_type:complete
MNVTGSCLCGRVRYRIDGEPGPLVYCHCAQCRKAQGVAFAANTPIPVAAFHLLCGADSLAGYRASAEKTRYFCRACGSPMYSHIEGAELLRLRAGTLDPGAKLVAVAHIFATSKAGWHDITDPLPQYPGREPGRD